MSPGQMNEMIQRVLLPYDSWRRSKLTASCRFAHYTSFNAAKSMIAGDALGERSLWLRSAEVMNDTAEIKYGQYHLFKALMSSEMGKRFFTALDNIHSEVRPLFLAAFQEDFVATKSRTFICSLSHHAGEALQIGRLSMWRAYGGETNVCFVFKMGPFVTDQRLYDVAFSPVFYGNALQFRRQFGKFASSIRDNIEELRQIDAPSLAGMLKKTLDFSVMSMKHPAFREEAEWRLLYQPDVRENWRTELPYHDTSIGGVAQRVYRIPLRNAPEMNLHGAELGEVLDYIIIGPHHDENATARELVKLLGAAGVKDPRTKVRFSGVPLRR
jgi:hypothetical protein